MLTEQEILNICGCEGMANSFHFAIQHGISVYQQKGKPLPPKKLFYMQCFAVLCESMDRAFSKDPFMMVKGLLSPGFDPEHPGISYFAKELHTLAEYIKNLPDEPEEEEELKAQKDQLENLFNQS